MKLIIQNINFEHTESLDEFVKSKFEKVENHNPYVDKIEIILSANKLENKAEANVHIKNHDIHAESVTADMYASIDKLASKIDKILIKYKSKNKH